MDQDGPNSQDTEDLAVSYEHGVTPPNSVPEEVIEIRVIGSKALRRIRDLGTGPGSGTDGDGDGLTDDGTRWERPATPRRMANLDTRRIWTQASDAIYARRKRRTSEAIARYRTKIKDAPRRYTKQDFIDLLKGADDQGTNHKELRDLAQFIFEHDLPNYRTSHVDSVRIVDADTDQPKLIVSGRIFDGPVEDDEPIGEFDRVLSPFNGGNWRWPLKKSGVIHERFILTDPDERERGIGSAFIAASEAMYSELGLEEISVTTGMSDGAVVWAKDGFDWDSDNSRGLWLEALIRAAEDLDPDGYSEIKELMNEALDEDIDDPERIMPIHVVSMPDFDELWQAAGWPDWRGKRAVRNYALASKIEEETSRMESEREEQIQGTFRTREEMQAIVNGLKEKSQTYDRAFNEWMGAQEKGYLEEGDVGGTLEEDVIKAYNEIEEIGEQSWARRIDELGPSEIYESYPDDQTYDDIQSFYENYLTRNYRKYNQFLRGLFSDLGSSWGGPIESRLRDLISPDNTSEKAQSLTDDQRKMIREMLAALEHEQQWSGSRPRTVYRGTLLSGKDRMSDVVPGDIITDDAPLSTTIIPGIGLGLSASHIFQTRFVNPLNFLSSDSRDNADPDTAMVRRMATGSSVTSEREATFWEIQLPRDTYYIPGNPSEGEMILPPGTGLEIVSVDRYKTEDPYWDGLSTAESKPSFVRIVAKVIDLKKQMLENTQKSAVSFTQEITEVKTFSTKVLRRIRDQGKGPGSGKDGDGDGLTDDGTRYERPAAPAVLKPNISEQWSTAYNQALARRTNAAKERIARMRKSGRQYRKEKYLNQINRVAQTQDTAAAKKLAEGIFNHSSIGKDGAYSSIVTAIDFDPDDTLGINTMQVGGNILDSRGRHVGAFSRTLIPNSTFIYGEGKSGVYHDSLQLDEYARDKGIARDFLLESEIQYSLAGLETIGLTAGLDSGPWIWARDNYDWLSTEDRESHLSAVLRIVNLMAQNEQMNRDLARAYRDVFRQALNEVFSDSERLRPVHLAYMPEFGKVQEAAKASGTPRYRFAWTGIRPVRPYRDMVMEEEE